jgi:hypothetical protein
MVTSYHSQSNLITEVFSIGFALKPLLRVRDFWKLQTRSCWSSLTSVSDERFDLPHPTDFPEVMIPVIIVFTKYDLLVVKHFRACSHILSVLDRMVEARNRAMLAFSEFTKVLKVPFVPVSTLKETQKEYGGLLIKSATSLFPLK